VASCKSLILWEILLEWFGDRERLLVLCRVFIGDLWVIRGPRLPMQNGQVEGFMAVSGKDLKLEGRGNNGRFVGRVKEKAKTEPRATHSGALK
jgi:hypothetical protein